MPDSTPSRSIPPTLLTLGARLSIYALTLLGLLGGGLIVYYSGFDSRISRDPYTTVFTDGPMAWAMACIEFTMAAIGVAAVLQMHGASRQHQWLGGLTAILLPVLALIYSV